MELLTRYFSKALLGRMAIFGSTFCFYISTVIVRWVKTEGLALESEFLVFGRFLLGFLIMAVIFLLKRELPRPRQYHFLLGRASIIFFSAALLVICWLFFACTRQLP